MNAGKGEDTKNFFFFWEEDTKNFVHLHEGPYMHVQYLLELASLLLLESERHEKIIENDWTLLQSIQAKTTNLQINGYVGKQQKQIDLKSSKFTRNVTNHACDRERCTYRDQKDDYD